MFIIILYVSTIILCTDLGMPKSINKRQPGFYCQYYPVSMGFINEQYALSTTKIQG